MNSELWRSLFSVMLTDEDYQKPMESAHSLSLRHTLNTSIVLLSRENTSWDNDFLIDIKNLSGPVTINNRTDDFLPALKPRDLLPGDFPDSIKCLFVITYVIIMLLSVLGNLLVILTIVTNAKMRSITNMFLVSLAVSDLLIATVNMPFQLKFYIQNEWTLGAPLCKFTRYMQGVVIVASIFTLTGIALDR